MSDGTFDAPLTPNAGGGFCMGIARCSQLLTACNACRGVSPNLAGPFVTDIFKFRTFIGVHGRVIWCLVLAWPSGCSAHLVWLTTHGGLVWVAGAGLHCRLQPPTAPVICVLSSAPFPAPLHTHTYTLLLHVQRGEPASCQAVRSRLPV